MNACTKTSPEIAPLRLAAAKAIRAARRVAKGKDQFMGSMPAAHSAGYSLDADRLGYAVFSEIFTETVRRYFPNGVTISR